MIYDYEEIKPWLRVQQQIQTITKDPKMIMDISFVWKMVYFIKIFINPSELFTIIFI